MTIYSRNKHPSGFYVYAYFTEDGICYYVGKGTGPRAWSYHSATIVVPTNKTKIVICEHNLTEIGAWAIERRLIRWYGRKDLGLGTLLNKSLGGGGSPGYKHTDMALTKMKNRTFSLKWRQTQSLFMQSDTNPSRDPKVAAKISRSNQGKVFTPDHRQKLSIAKIGKKMPEIEKIKRSNSLKGKLKGPQAEITCPYCYACGGTSNMKRYHFDNCKSRKRE